MAPYLLALSTVLVDIVLAWECKWYDVQVRQASARFLLLAIVLDSGVELTAMGDDNSTFFFSPCRNGIACGGNVMAAQVDAFGNCYNLGKWDAAIQPTLGYEGAFHFVYPNGLLQFKSHR